MIIIQVLIQLNILQLYFIRKIEIRMFKQWELLWH
jgi:hypothetical protein